MLLDVLDALSNGIRGQGSSWGMFFSSWGAKMKPVGESSSSTDPAGHQRRRSRQHQGTPRVAALHSSRSTITNQSTNAVVDHPFDFRDSTGVDRKAERFLTRMERPLLRRDNRATRSRACLELYQRRKRVMDLSRLTAYMMTSTRRSFQDDW